MILYIYIHMYTLVQTCTDGVQNGDETSADCGGSCGECGACAASPCENGGTCVLDASESAGYHCHCVTGFLGDTCATS